jgi:hypothetical protein
VEGIPLVKKCEDGIDEMIMDELAMRDSYIR